MSKTCVCSIDFWLVHRGICPYKSDKNTLCISNRSHIYFSRLVRPFSMHCNLISTMCLLNFFSALVFFSPMNGAHNSSTFCSNPSSLLANSMHNVLKMIINKFRNTTASVDAVHIVYKCQRNQIGLK